MTMIQPPFPLSNGYILYGTRINVLCYMYKYTHIVSVHTPYVHETESTCIEGYCDISQ